MAGKGRILNDDIAALRERLAIEDIIGERVTLRRTGSGLTGLCPFHDETSPSFSVSPARNLFHCFGCGESGDVITYVMKTENLTFTEAVERLADKVGFALRYADADPNYVPAPAGQRVRLIEANRLANLFFVDAFKNDPNAKPGHDYLNERALDGEAVAEFSVGYAPGGFDTLLNHLKGHGFTVEEIVTAGLAVKNEENGRIYDRFRGRLTWPIKDISGVIIGFGARRLTEDDKGPKWLNTPDTPLYKKSEVLYGIDTARKHIAADSKVVVVEGYGDVMACHLSGVPHAVATCGTAFGEGHIRIVRRLLRDEASHAGRVIFTFDGDEAGQKAALRAFKDNDKFASSTFVAVAPDGMDPLDLRLHKGEQAVRDLVDSAVPLVEFALKSALVPFDLRLSEGRVNALKALTPVLAGIRDVTMRGDYMRKVSGWLALPEHAVISAVRSSARNTSDAPDWSDVTAPEPETASTVVPTGFSRPNPNDLTLGNEREMLKCLLQVGAHDTVLPHVTVDAFTHPGYRAVFAALVEHRDSAPAGFFDAVRNASVGTPLESLVAELAVEPLRATGDDLTGYQGEVMRRLLVADVERRIANLKAELAVASGDRQTEVLSLILTLEKYRRTLR